ncbi:unnamed protein product [Caenorhabditis angaria]|uniref:Uncharacterized protein n=1 Tax=Caenorhabditis angaria TaxID=860376 RepID=A0A9P1IPJ6_9PELO|nr:unnamed protein product [Caenorhabditis angaria]
MLSNFGADKNYETQKDYFGNKCLYHEQNMTIIYRPVKLNSVCDALSRYIGSIKFMEKMKIWRMFLHKERQDAMRLLLIL